MTKMTKRALCAQAVVFALAATSASAAEQVKESYHPTVNGSPVTLMKDNLITQKLGGRAVNLDVYAGEFVRYDSNIYGSQNEESSTVFTTAVGALLQVDEKDRWNVRVEGQALQNVYSNHSEYNGQEGFLNARGAVVISPALTVRANGNVSRTNDNSRTAEDVYQTTYYGAGAGVTVAPSPYFSVDADYQHSGVRRENVYKDYEYDTDSITLRPSYAVTDNTRLYAQAAYEMANVRGKLFNDTNTLTGVVGAAWTYRDTARLYGEVGAAYMDFDDSHKAMDYAGDTKTRPTARVGGELALNADVKMMGQISYAPSISATSTSSSKSAYIDSVRVQAGLQYSPGAGRFTASATPYFSYNKPSNSEDDKYRDIGVTLGTTYCVKDWLNVSAGYRFTNTKYENSASYDRHMVMLGLALTL